MASLQWVKISIELFADERISILENEPQGERHLLLWFRLLLLAGKLNNSGFFILDGTPLTPKKIANIIKKKPSYVAGGMAVLCQNHLIEIENGTYFIPNWDKYQNEDKLEKIRENNRVRQQAFRERHRAKEQEMSHNSNVTVTPQNKNKKENKNQNENLFLLNQPTQIFEEDNLSPPVEENVGILTQSQSPKTNVTHLTQMVTQYCNTLPPEQNPHQIHTLLLTWLSNLQELNKLPTVHSLPLLLEKLHPCAKESGLAPAHYLEEVICRGWHSFYPIPRYGIPPKSGEPPTNKSYDINELEAMI